MTPEQKEVKHYEYIDRVFHDLYVCYGSGTGVLFGIPSNYQPAVRTIVKVILDREVKS